MSTTATELPELPAYPEHVPSPDYPVLGDPPKDTTPERGWPMYFIASGSFVTGYMAMVILRTAVESNPAAYTVAEAVNIGMGLWFVGAIVAALAYFLLTLPYQVREGRSARKHRAAVEAWTAESKRLREQWTADMAKHTADRERELEEYRELRREAFAARGWKYDV